MIAGLVLILWPALAGADGCAALPDTAARMQPLLDAARSARDETEGRAVGRAMWAVWAEAPDEASQAILDRGMRARERGDMASAMEAFNRLVDYCPHYAEGYNQRAFVNFLTGRYEAALPDLDHAIALSPSHVAAISGRALTLRALGRLREAHDEMARALELNPWLAERALMPIDPSKDI